MKTRRSYLAAGAALPMLAWTDALRAQAHAPVAPVVIGWLAVVGGEANLSLMNAFNEGMAALGWKVGEQYVLEDRHADSRIERLPALAQELAAKRPAVIVAVLSPSARAAADAAPTTPIVLANGNPVTGGLVTSLARPGGLITGVSNVTTETHGKVIELLVESVPKLRRVGFLADATAPNHADTVSLARARAKHFRLDPVIADVASPQDIAPAFVQLAKAKVEALVVLPSTWFAGHVATIVQAALTQRWPVVGTLSAIARQGGLFSFGIDTVALVRRSAYYVDRILKGAKPGDLPIELPTSFLLILNLKTAKLLGITFPTSMRLRATEVIE